MKKRKPKNIKKDIWNLVSVYVRLTNSVGGYCKCVSCGELRHWQEMQCGHFVHSKDKAWIDIRNLNPQCGLCNLGDGQIGYTEWMQEQYGLEYEDVRDDLKRLKKVPRKYTNEELENMLQYWKDKTKEMGE